MTNTSNLLWPAFYKELAHSLLQYKNDRTALLDLLLNKVDESYIKYLFEDGLSMPTDICPFTTIGIFNRKLTKENRINIATIFKEIFNLNEPIPNCFKGVPILHNLKSTFYNKKSLRGSQDIDNLWELFEQVLKDPYSIETIFNEVRNQYMININITMGLYWISSAYYLALDRNNTAFLKAHGINTPSKLPTFSKYKEIINEVKFKMKTNEIKENNFIEISKSATRITINNSESSIMKQLLLYKKNIILEGAPGVGKTYRIPEIVVELCKGLNIGTTDRATIMQEYNKLIDAGQVMFTTFHQSLDYEEFVEGLIPEVIDGEVAYKLEDGIFKQICEKAMTNSKQINTNTNRLNTNTHLFDELYNSLVNDIKSNKINKLDNPQYGEFNVDIQDGRIVFGENRKTESVENIKLLFDYFYDHNNFGQYFSIKEYHSLIEKLTGGKTRTIDYAYYHGVLKELFRRLQDSKEHLVYNMDSVAHTNNKKPFVLIIDEINRGNISKIFGELITLLENDKRIDQENGISVTLPYSKKTFGVPSNLYIIGTMNTSDRSLGQLDYALRRRFGFVKLTPYELDVDGFDCDLFRLVSELFIKNYDEYMDGTTMELVPADCLSSEFEPEDVWIGHSYFIFSDNAPTLLRWHFEIVPIIEEYIRDGIFIDTDFVNNRIDELYDYLDEYLHD